MSYLSSPPDDLAGKTVEEMFRVDRERVGYVPNRTKLFSLHPDAYKGWRSLIGAIAGQMDKRRYELASVGAARRLRSSYCSLAHGSILADDFYGPKVVEHLMSDPSSAPIDELERSIVLLAGKVADDATAVSEADIAALRDQGLSDREIFDVILAACARSFFSKVLDATGTLADGAYRELDPQLRDALTVGRPIEG